ncbi:hypothetical protein QYE76_014935 [Lolium multiflorum]|uniref:Protein kinase domain-containing protein n=1 Tax=Lolium multiflorum TaxID=4521 RepID=A0AAD8X5Y4_LOLMU|nr:hypothetical protein QYE76_014935 [Lolium multiflorum]
MIVQRAETVQRNRYECRQLANHAETMGDVLRQVLREHPEIDGMVGKLEATLREACVLVSSCQASSYFRRFVRSGKQAQQFQRIKEKIDFYLQLFPVISHIDTTRRLKILLDGVESPQTQNMAPRSPSNHSGPLASRSIINKDDSYKKPHAKTESFAMDMVAVDIVKEVRSSTRRDDDGHQLINTEAQGFSLFGFSSLANATSNFSVVCKIGEGGFGRVYKGQLHGLQVAIKRCFVESSPERLSDFENEIKFIPKLQHRNIVKLQGYCIHRKERILVYEYMMNKSLDKFIFGTRNRGSLSWDRLFAIIEGIAQGVVYLHLHSGLDIIHRDLKPSNILLDSQMNPKISDFGTARACPPDKSHKADVIAGTRGYMAPEYSNKGVFSGKTDVFSFGSLLLEMLTGKRNCTSYSIRERSYLSLHEYAWDMVFMEKALENLVHPSLCDENPRRMKQMTRCAHIALLCVQEDPADRPSMWDVVLVLNGAASAGLKTPKKPARHYGGKPRFGDLLRETRDRSKKTTTVVLR